MGVEKNPRWSRNCDDGEDLDLISILNTKAVSVGDLITFRRHRKDTNHPGLPRLLNRRLLQSERMAGASRR